MTMVNIAHHSTAARFTGAHRTEPCRGRQLSAAGAMEQNSANDKLGLLMPPGKPIGLAVLPTHRDRRGLSRIAPFQLFPRHLAPSRRKPLRLVETFSMSLLAVSQSTLEPPYFLPLRGQATLRESSGFNGRSCPAFLQKFCVELRTDQD
jgi:hypothetical protein